MIKPLGARVLIKPKAKEEATKNGIIIPDSAINPSFFVGEVIDVHASVTSVKVGDVVAHLKYGMEIMPTDDGDRYLVEEKALIAIYE